MGKSNYNDAGRRVKMTEDDHRIARREGEIGEQQIESSKRNEESFSKIEAKLKADPELRGLLIDHDSHVMFKDLVRGMSAKEAAWNGPEGGEQGKQMKVDSIEALKKVRAKLQAEDE